MPSVIPAKTFECLATGKPTVVSGLSSLQDYHDLFYLCKTREEFLEALDRAMHEDDPALRERRLQCARENDWSRRIEQLEDNLKAVLREKTGPAQHAGPEAAPWRHA